MIKKSFIIGYPLNKPRSVPIWKSYFKKKRLNILMKSKEILAKNFHQEFKKMVSDKDFVATAVTMPFKKLAYRKVTPKNQITKLSKSVNLIIKYRNKLIGFNTDIEAALKIIKNKKKNKILIIGLGGTGNAFYNVLIHKYKKSKFFIITSQNKKNKKNVIFMKKIKEDILNQIDLVINCSPLGSNLKRIYINKSPLKLDNIRKIKKSGFIFDIVYKPKTNLLSKLCKKRKIKYENGLRMNTLQAKLALKYLDKFVN